jgi:predicted transposase/invertase (TIGR01784 family)
MRYVKKLEAGMAYAQIKPTITICLLVFDLLEEEEAYRNAYSVRNDKSGNRLCEDMQIIYLELPKFLRHLCEGRPSTGLERWLLYFTNEEGERMDKAVAENPALSAAREMESVFWADAKEKELYFAHQRMLLDAYSDEHTHEYLLAQAVAQAKEEGIKEGIEKGLEEGIEKGIEKGLEEGVTKVVRNLLQKGFDMETIVQVSGLSKEDIDKLR